MSFQSLQSSLQVLFVSSTALVDSLSLNKCIHYHDSVTPCVANCISCNTGNSYGTFFFFLYRAVLRLTLQVTLKIKSWYVTCLYVHVVVGAEAVWWASLNPAVWMRSKWLAEASWGGDPTETLIRACLARPRLTLLIDIHYLQWLFIPA